MSILYLLQKNRTVTITLGKSDFASSSGAEPRRSSVLFKLNFVRRKRELVSLQSWLTKLSFSIRIIIFYQKNYLQLAVPVNFNIDIYIIYRKCDLRYQSECSSPYVLITRLELSHCIVMQWWPCGSTAILNRGTSLKDSDQSGVLCILFYKICLMLL